MNLGYELCSKLLNAKIATPLVRAALQPVVVHLYIYIYIYIYRNQTSLILRLLRRFRRFRLLLLFWL